MLIEVYMKARRRGIPTGYPGKTKALPAGSGKHFLGRKWGNRLTVTRKYWPAGVARLQRRMVVGCVDGEDGCQFQEVLRKEGFGTVQRIHQEEGRGGAARDMGTVLK